MGFTCTPQITGLIRGKAKTKVNGTAQRHRHNGAGWLMECMNERKSRSYTLDRSRTAANDYHGLPQSASEVWDDVLERADAYRVEGVNKNGKAFSRRLRKDAVVGIGLIVKPPAEIANTWSREEQERFADDTLEVLHELQPRLFSRKKVRARVTHKDEEGPHQHIYLDATDDDGAYCGNLIDAAFLARVNREYPRLMRSRGWDLDDLDVTDWQRYKTDETYRRERDAKRKQQGRPPMDEVARREQAVSEREQALAQRERVLDEREQMLASREETLQTLMDEAHDVRKEHMRAAADYEKARADCEKAAQQATVGGVDPFEFTSAVFRECARDQDDRRQTKAAAFLRKFVGGYLEKIVNRVLRNLIVPPRPETPAVRRRVVDEPQEQGAQDDGLSL